MAVIPGGRLYLRKRQVKLLPALDMDVEDQ